jgi:hypothetical protein
LLFHEQEAWLASHRTDITAKIEEGHGETQCGELLDPDGVRRELDQRKPAWLTEHQPRRGATGSRPKPQPFYSKSGVSSLTTVSIPPIEPQTPFSLPVGTWLEILPSEPLALI